MAKKTSASSTTDEAVTPAVEPSEARPAYVVLARKYRPATFEDLIGQDAMVTTLKNAFASGRIAQGYMLTGVRGVGKTTTARILARALNFAREGLEDRPTTDLAIPGRHCVEIMESRHPDVIEMDAASNTGVDNIREIIESARYKPLIARYKVFIIDEVHMLSKGAFNALLKTLEEPPGHVKFIFATTEIRKVPVTVLSRCQRFDLRRVDVPELAAHFRRIVEMEGAKATDEALALIARAGGGSVRDGLSILDQAIAMGRGEVKAEAVRAMLGLADRGRILDLLGHLFAGEPGAAITALGGLQRDGAEPAQVLTDLADAVHATTRLKVVGVESAGEALSAEEKRRIAAYAERLTVPFLSRVFQMLLKGCEEAARAPDPAAAADMVLIRIAYTADLPSPDEIIRAMGGGRAPPRRASSAPREESGDGRGPLNSAGSPPVARQVTAQLESDLIESDDLFNDNPAEAGDEGEGLEDEAVSAGSRPLAPQLRSFLDVVALIGEHRDARLKVHLEEHVSLVKFDGGAGSIDLFLLHGAPPEIANELREKLNRWTARRWVVVLSKDPGEPPIGEVRRQREAAELEELKKHPAVAAVLEEFPGSKIAEVRNLDLTRDDDSATG